MNIHFFTASLDTWPAHDDMSVNINLLPVINLQEDLHDNAA